MSNLNGIYLGFENCDEVKKNKMTHYLNRLEIIL